MIESLQQTLLLRIVILLASILIIWALLYIEKEDKADYSNIFWAIAGFSSVGCFLWIYFMIIPVNFDLILFKKSQQDNQTIKIDSVYSKDGVYYLYTFSHGILSVKSPIIIPSTHEMRFVRYNNKLYIIDLEGTIIEVYPI